MQFAPPQVADILGNQTCCHARDGKLDLKISNGKFYGEKFRRTHAREPQQRQSVVPAFLNEQARARSRAGPIPPANHPLTTTASRLPERREEFLEQGFGRVFAPREVKFRHGRISEGAKNNSRMR